MVACGVSVVQCVHHQLRRKQESVGRGNRSGPWPLDREMGLLGNSNSLVSDIGESNAVYVYNRFGIVFHQSSFKCYHFFFSGSDSIGLMSNCYNGRLTGGETLPIKRPEKTTDWNGFMFLFPLR